MYLSSIVINNFKNFNKTKVKFKDGINIIVGPNNAGKTNLLKAIMLLNKNEKMEVSDFNHNELSNNLAYYQSNPPVIEIYYSVEHLFEPGKIDSSIIKLKDFIIFENDGNLKTQEDGKFKIVACFTLRYEISDKYISEYRKKISQNLESANNKFESFKSTLSGFVEYYRWNYYDVSKRIVESNYIKDIFALDMVIADRTLRDVIPQVQKTVKKKIDKHNEKESIDIKQELSEFLNQKLIPVKDDIKKIIMDEQHDIGITQGNNEIHPNFKYDTEPHTYFNFHLVDKDKSYDLPIGNNGLGYNNLIYLYSILKFKDNDDYNLLLIEEPEAHLHPAMQYQLFKYLQKQEESEAKRIKNQIIITTHSSNISASSNIDDIISLHYYRGDEPCVVAENLSEKFLSDDVKIQEELARNKNHLKKFLDVTRSDILFTEKVILVEGITEKLLMPMFASKLDFDLIRNHISFVEIGGINFSHFKPLFKDSKNKLICIRDCDYKYEYPQKGIKEYEEHIKKFKTDEKDNILTVTQKNGGSTLEDEMFIDNFIDKDLTEGENTVCKELLKIVLPDSVKSSDLIKRLDFEYWLSHLDLIKNSATKEKITDMISKYNEWFEKESKPEVKQKINILFFANVFKDYVSSQKGNVALKILMSEWNDKLKVPNYIEEGLIWMKL